MKVCPQVACAVGNWGSAPLGPYEKLGRSCLGIAPLRGEEAGVHPPAPCLLS